VPNVSLATFAPEALLLATLAADETVGLTTSIAEPLDALASTTSENVSLSTAVDAD